MLISNLKKIALCISGFIGFFQSTYAFSDFHCPVEISTTSTKLKEVPDLWVSANQPHRLFLVSARFFDGPPEKIADLKGEDIKSDGKTRKTRWVFEGEYPDGKWLGCSYGRDNIVLLAREIPKEISECTVIHKIKEDGKAYFDSVQCK